jgi:hypothetical protein
MAARARRALVYALKGHGIEITYKTKERELTVVSDDLRVSTDGKLEVERAVEREIGALVTAVLLPSTRNGTRITLTLLLPDVNLAAGQTASGEVTGAAIVTQHFENVVGGAPPVLKSYDVRPLRGSASPG